MNAVLPTIPTRVGDRILLRATKHDATWQCVSEVTGKVCNRIGTCKLRSWTNPHSAQACKQCIVIVQRHLRGDTGNGPLRKATGVEGEYFRCKPLDLVHTRRSCSLLYARFNSKVAEHIGGSCTKCAIGNAHAKKQAHPEALALAMPVPKRVCVPERLCCAPKCKRPLRVGVASYCDHACREDANRAGIFASMMSAGLNVYLTRAR